MDTLEYIRIFRLDQENFQYNRQGFIDALGSEFTANLNIIRGAHEIAYSEFLELITKFFNKFQDIKAQSTIKPTLGVWKAFYAQYVLKIRRELFPLRDRSIRVKNGYGYQLANTQPKV